MARHASEVPLDKVTAEEKPRKCSECGGTEFRYDGGERFCKKCGLVVD